MSGQREVTCCLFTVLIVLLLALLYIFKFHGHELLTGNYSTPVTKDCQVVGLRFFPDIDDFHKNHRLTCLLYVCDDGIEHCHSI